MIQQKIDVLLVPMADKFQNEYLPEDQKRIQWLTGFSGSAGYVIVTHQKSALFVDSRYITQAKQQVSPGDFQVTLLKENAIRTWLQKNLKEGDKIGFDPWLHSCAEIRGFKQIVKNNHFTLVSLAENLIDKIWVDKPETTKRKAYDLSEAESGCNVPQKINILIEVLKAKKINIPALICDVTASNWLLNMRGYDLEYTPVFFNYTFLNPSGRLVVFTFIEQIPKDILNTFSEMVIFKDWSEFDSYIQSCDNLYLPLAHVPEAVREICERYGVSYQLGEDFYSLPKARKNAVEVSNMRECHIADGLAVTRFIHYIKKHYLQEVITESSASEVLEQFRKKSPEYLCPSFRTISAVGANAALPHYSFLEEDNVILEGNNVYLFDSGGQYTNGTTDITRTLFLGESPSKNLKKRYTLVLKGHIALAQAEFPKDVSGINLDILARQFLWQEGLDYGHGTGHGVGYRLNVHEGPVSISPRSRSQPPIEEGMIFSNEPGYYKENNYGIRLENMMVVKKSESNQNFLSFETLSLAPFERSLIDNALLQSHEKEWLNDYHKKVFEAHKSFLDENERAWLQGATEKIF